MEHTGISRFFVLLSIFFILIVSLLHAAFADEIDDVKSIVKKMKIQLDEQQTRLNAQDSEIRKLNEINASGHHSSLAVKDSSDVNDNVIDEISEYIEEHEDNLHTSKLKISGWADVVYQDRDSDNYNRVVSPQHLYLNFDARLDDSWRLFAEIKFENIVNIDSASTDGALIMERLYIEYNYTDMLNARIGKFGTPLGLWTSAHWDFYVPSVQNPIHEENEYVPEHQVGVQGFGRWTTSSASKLFSDIKFSLWTSTGSDTSGTDSPQDDKFAYGIDINARSGDSAKIGLTGYTQRNPDEANRRENTLQPYVELYLPGDITFSGEYQHQDRRNSINQNVTSWYTSAKWQLTPQSYLYYRFDKGDDELNGAGESTTLNVLTFGYWPMPYVRTKLEFSTHQFETASLENFNQWNAWIGVQF